MKRKIPLVTGQIYHIVSKSIADYKIFNSKENYSRIIKLLNYYQKETNQKFSDFIGLKKLRKNENLKLVKIVAYCIMPTHIHLILEQLQTNGISKYLGTILNSYSRFFNIKHKRKGPLWQTKFNNILVDSDEQLLHLTRYIHLNPVTAGSVKKPEDWNYSSYVEYIKNKSNICEFQDIINLDLRNYSKFVNERISYQKELAQIKAILLD